MIINKLYIILKMSVKGVYIGYGIEIFLENIEDYFDFECNDIQDYFKNNKVWNMNLLALEKIHDDEEMMYVGAFIKIGDGFNLSLINQFDNIKQLSEHPFRKICVEKIGVKPKLMTVVVGCSCC